MKAYKGFNKDMTCRGFQYEEGKTYETDTAKLCGSGFHACTDPLDCFNYYSPRESVYHEVEMEEVTDEKSNDDSKICGKSVKIGAQINIADICKLHFAFVKSKCKTNATAGDGGAATAGDRGAATAGDRGAATAGDRGAATAGYGGAATAGDGGAATAGDCGAATTGYGGAATAGNCGAATAGDCGAATAGNCGAATAGYGGAATAGDRGAATAGNCGAATAGNCGAATAGDRGAATAGYGGAATAGDGGAATSRGMTKVGEQGIALARGNEVRAKGGLGSVLVLVEEKSDSYEIKEWKVTVVDGKIIKADTWYMLKNGEFVEAKEVKA